MVSRGRIMMLTTHGYVAAQPELGRPDTGGQVVYVLELSRTLALLGGSAPKYESRRPAGVRRRRRVI